MTIPVERVYRSIGVTEAVNPRNRDVLAMTLLLQHIDRTTSTTADEWDELAEAGARIVASTARESDDFATERELLSRALHEARSWVRARNARDGDARRSPADHSRAGIPTPRAASRVRVRTVIREL